MCEEKKGAESVRRTQIVANQGSFDRAPSAPTALSGSTSTTRMALVDISIGQGGLSRLHRSHLPLFCALAPEMRGPPSLLFPDLFPGNPGEGGKNVPALCHHPYLPEGGLTSAPLMLAGRFPDACRIAYMRARFKANFLDVLISSLIYRL